MEEEIRKRVTHRSLIKLWIDTLHTSVNGRGLDQVEDSPGNHWFQVGTRFMTGRTFINLCRLRTNTLMCREFNTRGQREGMRICRMGCPKVEWLSHILQGCPISHWTRVTRHNKLLSLVSDKFINLGFQVTMEPRIHLDGNLRKPDLLVVTGDTLTVCDLTVGWETPSTLDDRHLAKVAYYDTYSMREYLKSKWPNHIHNFQAISLSCRGGISALSHAFLKNNGWTRQDISLLCLRCMEKTLTIYWAFFTNSSKASALVEGER